MMPNHNPIASSRSHLGLGVDVGRTALQTVYVPPVALSETAFCDWIASAMVGQSIQYHEGLLLVDRSEAGSPLPTKERARLHAVARRAWIACELCLVHLFSLKVEEGHYRYIAVRSSSVLTPPEIRTRLHRAGCSSSAPASTVSH